MMKQLLSALLCTLLVFFSFANDYEAAWKAIEKKNFREAEALLLKASKVEATALDAQLTLLYLNTYRGREDAMEELTEKLLSSPDRNAYLFSLWFNGSILGEYQKKRPHQWQLLNKILTDKRFNGSIQTAAKYVKAMHFVFANNYAKARQEWQSMGSIQDWQLVGPFENISGSGFNAHDAAVLAKADGGSFKGINNIDISWFTPLRMNREGWIFTYPHVPVSSAIVYAQSFVYAPEDMDVLLNVGGNGAIKVWVNDGLVLSEHKERKTELDYYKNSCQLKKGYNRVLIQLGYTDNNIPNFIVRFSDKDLAPLPGLTWTAAFQPYTMAAAKANVASIKHFSEQYFEAKIAGEPRNLINYILLSQAYLRNHRTTEARKVVELALQQAPDNPLLRFELIQCLLKAENRTMLMQEIEWLKDNDPGSYINYQLKIEQLSNEEKYVEAEEQLQKMMSEYEEDDFMLQAKAELLGKQEKIDELLRFIDKGYKKDPENALFAALMFNVRKMVHKDPKGAMNIFENYLKVNFNYNMLSILADEYKQQGLTSKYLDVLKRYYDQAGHDPEHTNMLAQFYFEKGDYGKALQYAQEALKLAPYTGSYWNNVGSIQEEMNKKDDAIASYTKAVYYDRTNYDARKKLNQLLKKQDLYKLLPETDIYALIKKAPLVKDYDWGYLLDEKGTIIYSEGASEEYITYAIKIYNQKGIDTWKELSIPYNGSAQTLMIEKSEVVKANGSKLPAERSDNELVFTNLEAGDAIYVKYRLQNYGSGRIGREFTDKFIFNSFSPTATARYTLIVPKDYPFSHKMLESDMKPVIRQAEDYSIYTWEMQTAPILKREPLMPPLRDVAAVLHLSTIKSWPEVAQWYSDISYQSFADNFELSSLYNEIFEGTGGLTELQKAKKIYEYIVTNIRYSSVSFRQSGLVPQDVSKIISSRLGDCKDLSTLFIALAAKAGIKAQYVLIDTRDYGKRDMVLPSIDFNHCIVVTYINNKEYFLELTDSDLPFGSLPNNLYEALALVIPPHGQKTDAGLIHLKSATRTQDKAIKKINVTLQGKDQLVQVHAAAHGNNSTYWRSVYSDISAEEQMEEMQKLVSRSYNNPVKLEKLALQGLDNLSDSVIIDYAYSVKNEVIEAGSMKMVKLRFIDIVATVDKFSSETRSFPIEYWTYENTDVYETELNIQLGQGQSFMEIPANQSFAFKNSKYKLQFVKEGSRLKVTRSVQFDRSNIPPAEYEAFRKFMNDIVEAESKYVVIK